MTLDTAYTIVVLVVLTFLFTMLFLYMLRRAFKECQQLFQGTQRLFLSIRELSNSSRTPILILALLKIVIPADDEQENIIGDLFEEYNQFPSRLKAHFWLYEQVINSVFPLIYKTIKNRLLSKIKERIR